MTIKWVTTGLLVFDNFNCMGSMANKVVGSEQEIATSKLGLSIDSGATFSLVDCGLVAEWGDIVSNGTVFLIAAVGNNLGNITNKCITSVNGVTWTQRVLPIFSRWGGGGAGRLGRLFLFSATNRLFKSDDNGATWSEIIIGFTALPQGNRFTVAPNGNLVLIGQNTVTAVEHFFYSADNGLTWTQSDACSSTSFFSTLNGLCTANDKVVAFMADGEIKSSPDGITWTIEPSPISTVGNFSVTGGGVGVVYDGLNVVIIYQDRDTFITYSYASSDLVHWTPGIVDQDNLTNALSVTSTPRKVIVGSTFFMNLGLDIAPPKMSAILVANYTFSMKG